MNRIGANTWIWVSPLTDERLAGVAPRVAELGFDGIELPIESPGDWDPDRARELLAGLGLSASTCIVMSPDRDLLSDDLDVVRSTQAYVRAGIAMTAAAGATVFAGPLYAPVGRTWLLAPGERERALGRLAGNLRPLVDAAVAAGVTLALEPLNRFETSFVNTAEQAMEIVERVASPGLGVLLDTFHMNIEEPEPAAAIRRCAGHLAHFHACGCDRGAPGRDHIPWPEIALALRDIGYGGSVVVESFTSENQAIARAAAIWRPLAASPDALASDGLRFLRELLAGQGAA
ncbi:MAG: sugar phosphate isomerase/epimerase [Candidatus Dormibacteraeota bacterium]|nr:sugar phosphate isomerase/epimerase [Candidatus Dormibacteraeota bacterium]